LHGLASHGFVLSRGRSCLIRAVSLLRLAAPEVSSKRFGEALAASGFAWTGGAGLDPIRASWGGAVDPAGQSHNFLSKIFQIASLNSPRGLRKRPPTNGPKTL
jgi:hypothetical protein